MKIRYTGAIVFGVLIVIGVAILLPVYYQERPRPTIMLSFSIINDNNILKWCNDLSSTLQKYDIKATVFMTGKLAESYPKCVSLFSSNHEIDLGSSTYNYANLASISNYSSAFEEVRNGKRAIDQVGKLNSKVFKAPYGSTNEDIYSLLSRSGILADFSYTGQYNKYENGQFIKYDLVAYNGSTSSSSKELFNSLSSKEKPVLISFDNSIPVSQIDSFISKVKSQINDVYFANASDLTDVPLSVRKEV